MRQEENVGTGILFGLNSHLKDTGSDTSLRQLIFTFSQRVFR